MANSPVSYGARCAALEILLCLTAAPELFAQGAVPAAGEVETDGVLRRRAEWHARIAPIGSDSGARVYRVDVGSPAERAGLRKGDRLVGLNGRRVETADAFWPSFWALRGGDTVRARIVRDRRAAAGADTLEVRLVLDSVPHERIPGTVATYGAVRSDRGYLLRTVVNRPDRRTGGLEDELAAPHAGLRALRGMAGVDPERIFLLGGSIGGALAPILAAEEPQGIAGVIAVGGFARTWYEHMLDIERRRLTLMGRPPAEVNAAMRGFAQFYTDYLLEHRTPAELLARRTALRPLWYDEPGHQYGRPAAYYHAVQALDVEAAWAAVAERGIPALVVRGEYDWIMGPAEAERAVEIVNARRPGLARLIV